jgi:hypothetical protein
MNDWDISCSWSEPISHWYRMVPASLRLVYSNIPNLVWRTTWIRQEQDIPSVECWFHRSSALSALAFHKRKLTYDSTTTIGDSELVTRHRPFHIINPDAMTVRKLRA